MKMYFVPEDAGCADQITEAEDRDFLFLLQNGLLLGLKAEGLLSEMEYRRAEEALLRQYRQGIRTVSREAERD